MPLLEGLVKKHAPALTRREQQVAAIRVQLDTTRLIGVRFPEQLLEDLQAELARARAAAGRAAASGEAEGRLRKELQRAVCVRRTLHAGQRVTEC